MQVMKASVVLAGSAFLLFFACLGEAAVPEQTISGTLMTQAGPFQCDQCLVSLLANGIRPVNTTYLDLGGHFTLRGVSPGTYTIHVEIEGFEDVNQQVEVHDALGWEPTSRSLSFEKRLRPGTAAETSSILRTSWRPIPRRR